MDVNTKELVDDFITFLAKELPANKRFRKSQVLDWSLVNFRLTVNVFIEGIKTEIYFDLREIKDNRNHFMHLLNSAFAQLEEKMKHA